MKCKECNDETNQIKAGKTKAGIQKYKCKICGKRGVPFMVLLSIHQYKIENYRLYKITESGFFE